MFSSSLIFLYLYFFTSESDDTLWVFYFFFFNSARRRILNIGGYYVLVTVQKYVYWVELPFYLYGMPSLPFVCPVNFHLVFKCEIRHEPFRLKEVLYFFVLLALCTPSRYLYFDLFYLFYLFVCLFVIYLFLFIYLFVLFTSLFPLLGLWVSLG